MPAGTEIVKVSKSNSDVTEVMFVMEAMRAMGVILHESITRREYRSFT